MMSKFKQKLLRQHNIRIKLLLLIILAFQVTLFGQEKQVIGTVTDVTGLPLSGVNVVIRGTQTGTVTDLSGNYKITVSSEQDVLVYTYIGFLEESVMVGTQTEINLSLSEDILQLNEVVVVGYGTQKKSDLTGAVASVKAEELQKIPVSGINVALQGQTPGIQVSQTTGAPGSSVRVYIRGVSSINQRDPVWIVDGIPASPNSVNPSDVESLEILKDASSASIYGANGANGVILITTKKGKSGKPVVSLNYYHAFQTIPTRLEVATGPEFGAMWTELQATRGLQTFTFPDYQNLPTYDYQDMIFRTALMDNIDFNVSGGNDKMVVYFGMGYNNQEGILRSSEYNRLNLRLNTDYTVNKWFKVGENISFNKSNTSGFEEWQYLNEYETPIINALTVHPYLPPYDSTGNWVPKPSIGNQESPLPTIELLNKEFNRYEGIGTVYVIIEPIKGLSLQSSLNGALTFTDDHDFLPTYNFGPGLGEFNNIDEIIRHSGKTFSYLWQNTITYKKTLFGNFNTSVMAGYEVNESKHEEMGGRRRYLYTEEPEQWYFDGSTDDTSRAQIANNTGTGSESSGYAYFGRLSFDYQSKYLVQLNIRYDASSRFGPQNREGTFPGFSVGWKFSEENFIKDRLSFLSFGKLRYGWGTAGINTIRDYAYFPTVSYQSHFSYPFNNTSTLTAGAGPDVAIDPAIRWEEVVTQNLGIDLSFFANRLTLTVDKFQRHNNGMLVLETLPGYAGWTVRDISQESGGVDPRPTVNIGNMLNKGWEFSTGWRSSYGKLKYAAEVNYTYVKSTIEKLGADSVRYSGTAQGLSGNITRSAEGEEIGLFYGYQVDRIFQQSDAGVLPNGRPGIINQPYIVESDGDTLYAQSNAQPGDFKFRDVNNDGRINNLDQTSIGNPFPHHLLGLNLNVSYGIFDLSMFWQGTFGNDIFNAVKYLMFNQDGQYNWSKDYIDNHYRAQDVVATDVDNNVIATFPANVNAKYPRLDPRNSNVNFNRISDFYVENGSYLRLKNLQLGVSLPDKWINKLTLTSVRIYAGARNIITFTKYTGMDPEVPIGQDNANLLSGIDKAAYPQPRVFLFGANIKF